MDISVLTFPLSNNYGCLLQAYALQTTLEQMGHNVVILDKRDWRVDSFCGWCMRLLKNVFLYYFLRKKEVSTPSDIVLNQKKNVDIISCDIKKFVNSKLHLSSRFYFFFIYKFRVESYSDAYVVGSDQVWRYTFFKNNITNYFFNFVLKDKIRIAYAASFGVDKWEYSNADTMKCRRLLEKFNGVSVREDSGVELCKEYFQIDALHVLDPTFLILKDVYNKMFNLSTSKKEAALMTYILDENSQKLDIISYISNYLSLKVETNMPQPLNKQTLNNIDECVYLSVDLWLQNMSNAEFIVTDSFHGCVFSIIFNRPFVVIDNQKRGSTRIVSLLRMFNLMERMVSSIDKLSLVIDKEIDWSYVNQNILIQRERALMFLKNSLSGKPEQNGK